MNNVIEIDFIKKTKEVEKPLSNIAIADDNGKRELVGSHTAEPIKDITQINQICEYLLGKRRYRDHMLFVLGINFGLRVSDLIVLKFSDLIGENLCFKVNFPILEKKTENTRKVKRNRVITINDAVKNAVSLYLEHVPGCKLSDYLFKSESNNGKYQDRHISRKSVDRLLKDIGEELGFNIKIATHTLRKTFGYHQMLMSNNDPRKLLLLQKIFGHSSVTQTLSYIGITDEEISMAYMEMNLGINDIGVPVGHMQDDPIII